MFELTSRNSTDNFDSFSAHWLMETLFIAMQGEEGLHCSYLEDLV
jgi:hypothetical protein